MYSKRIAEFTSQLRYDDLPQDVIDTTKKCILDIIGVAIGGSNKPASEIWLDTLKSFGGPEEASVWMPGFPKMPYLYAACANGAFGHVLDMDDLHNSSITHLAVITVPAAIAMGEKIGKSGQDIINAVVAGYDVGARIGDAINPSAYWFWHTTGVAGNFSAAATVGKLLNLDVEQMNHCFGTAGSQAAGLWEFMNDGAMSKTVHAGKACMNGIMAAELASRGFTGATRILEGDKGFVKAVAKEYDLEALTRDFGQPHKVMTNSLKPYACCRHTHSAIYAIQQLIKDKGLKAENVESILDRTYSTAVDLTDNPTPQTLYGHKFSLQYIIAAALVYGDVLDNVFTEDATTNPLVQETMQKVTMKLDEALDAEYKASPEKWIHELDIQMKDGQTHHIRVEYPLGDFNNPFDWNMADNKFKNVTAEFLNLKEQEALLDKIHSLEEIDNINELFKF